MPLTICVVMWKSLGPWKTSWARMVGRKPVQQEGELETVSEGQPLAAKESRELGSLEEGVDPERGVLAGV